MKVDAIVTDVELETVASTAARLEEAGFDGFLSAEPVFVSSGTDEESMARAHAWTRDQIAFYGSTPAYRKVLAHHGWGELGDELHALSLAGGWEDMGRLVPDEVVDAFSVGGSRANWRASSWSVSTS